MSNVKWVLGVLILILFSVRCKKDQSESCNQPVETYSLELPTEPFDYSLSVPDHIQGDPLFALLLDNQPSDNIQDNDVTTLGRVLFYDTRLSTTNDVACASCHFQENAFSFPSEFSEGIDGFVTDRSSMALVNLRWNRRFFWDLRENRLEDQVLVPIQHPGEMGSDLASLVDELAEIDDYSSLFDAAFGTAEVNEERIAKSLSQFLRALYSFDSRYDQGVENDFSDYSAEELAGKNLFFSGVARCNNCHTPQLFSSSSAMNNGLEIESIDLGQYLATGEETDIGEFKVPTLRNIAVTAPYMHDGRFQTLEEVVQFYNTDIQPHQNLNDRITEETMMGGTPVQLGLSEEDVSNLVAFLHTLNDDEFLTSEKFSNPFN